MKVGHVILPGKTYFQAEKWHIQKPWVKNILVCLGNGKNLWWF